MSIYKDLITICVATYDQEQYITDCLNSIKKQTYKNIKIIISDDFSQDTTVKKIKKFLDTNKNLNITFYRQKKNLGISQNINFLRSKVKEKYSIFFAGDDLMYPTKIYEQLKALQKNQQSPFCYTNCAWLDQTSGKIIFNHYSSWRQNSKTLNELLSDNSLPTPTIMYNTKFLPNKIFNEKFKYLGDFTNIIDLWHNAKEAPIYINKVLSVYRKHPDSVMSKKKINQERIELINFYLKKFKNDRTKINSLYKFKKLYLFNKGYEKILKKKLPIKEILIGISSSAFSLRWAARVYLMLINIFYYRITKKFYKNI